MLEQHSPLIPNTPDLRWLAPSFMWLSKSKSNPPKAVSRYNQPLHFWENVFQTHLLCVLQLSLSPGTPLHWWATEFDPEDLSLPRFFPLHLPFLLARPCSSSGNVLSPCAHSSPSLVHDVLTFNWTPFRWEQHSLPVSSLWHTGVSQYFLNDWMNEWQS